MCAYVRLHHFRYVTYKISSSWFLLYRVYAQYDSSVHICNNGTNTAAQNTI
jgi:hypothetical protein